MRRAKLFWQGWLVSLLLACLWLPAQAVMLDDGTIEFTLADHRGKSHTLSDYRGQWVVVNYWATWCGPCIHELPELNRFYQDYLDKGVLVLGINFEDIDAARLQQAIEELNIVFPVLPMRADSEPLIPFEPLRGLPSTFVVSPEGRLVKTWLGPLRPGQLQSYFASRLPDQAAAADTEETEKQP